MQRYELKTLWKHARSTHRAEESTKKAQKTLEKIEDEMDALNSSSSKYKNAVSAIKIAIKDACIETAKVEDTILTSEGIDLVRRKIEKVQKIKLKMVERGKLKRRLAEEAAG